MNIRLLTVVTGLCVAMGMGIAWGTPPKLPEMTPEERELDALVTHLCEREDGKGLMQAIEAAENMRSIHGSASANRAIKKLGEMEYAEAVGLLCKLAAKDKISAVQALARIGGEEAVGGIIQAARFGGRRIVRERAAGLLGGVDDPRAAEALFAILADAEEPGDLREIALRSLTAGPIDEARARKLLAATAAPDDPLAGTVLSRMGRQRPPAVLSPLIETLAALLERIDEAAPTDAGDEEAAARAQAAAKKCAELFDKGLTALECVAHEVAGKTDCTVILRAEVSVVKGEVESFGYKKAEVRANQAERKRVLALWAGWWKENRPLVVAEPPAEGDQPAERPKDDAP